MLEVKNLTMCFKEIEVCKNFNISIEENKITCILGSSGCGKTTLLNIIAGILKPSACGFNGFVDKTFSYIFQQPRLIEWKTVKQNMDFVLKDSYDNLKRKEIIEKYLDIVELNEFGDYYPAQLSEGMKQRASIARAFAYSSDVLLMDEPFNAIDLKLKLSVMESFIKMWNQDRRTVMFVTHDIEEALMLADNIYLLDALKSDVESKFAIETPQMMRKYRDEAQEALFRKIYNVICQDKI